ncbi:unnamed protein product [Fraxinus pennsylvanica]|uniref:Ribosomal protein/NADH dehydrogenase domain-containing protein n=1 Tax=Fraxinus pennsylvanica TaxID=56036 RepID=A0AAD1YXZ4_9LAMI|nr:unnamed protein product [Fraxinus pennsylvanica]
MAWRGQLSRNLKELRLLFCQTSSATAPARSFVEKNYMDLKKQNPKFPILIYECRGVEPQLWARYDMGVERGIRWAYDVAWWWFCDGDRGSVVFGFEMVEIGVGTYDWGRWSTIWAVAEVGEAEYWRKMGRLAIDLQ